MSVGSNLQEMENVVTKDAQPAEPMPNNGAQWEDLGGPTPENSRPDDNSNQLKTPGATLKQVKDVVNAKAKPAEAVSDEIEDGQEVVAEDEVAEVATENGESIVSEEETTEEEVVAEEEELTVDVETDIQALVEGEELSEEFQNKARTIFEAAIKTKVSEIKEDLQTAYEQALVEEVHTIKEELTDRVDGYLEYVADEWVQENALQVEAGLKTEMTESFLEGMKGLFEEHYVQIPEEKYDVLHSMVEKLDEMEGKLNEQINKNVALNKRLSESSADVVLSDVSEGLALSQKEKLATLAENVEFDSEDTYREKLVTLRKSYFPENAGVQKDTSETISEGMEEAPKANSNLMETYLQTLTRVAKK